MKTEHKVYIAAGLLVALSGATYLVLNKDSRATQAREAPAASGSGAAPSTNLPKLKLGKDDIAAITKLEVKNKEKGDVALTKTGTKKEGDKDVDEWALSAPLKAPANAANVKSTLDSLEKLELSEMVSNRAEGYDKFELDDEKSVHLIAYKGDEKLLDIYFGKQGSRGRLARLGDQDGAFIVKGYTEFQVKRDLKSWRETKIWKFEADNAISVEIENKNGLFSFSKNDDKWSQSFKRRDDKGKLGEKPVEKWEKWKADKVKDMVRAMQTLNAEDFAAEGADTGLDDAVKNGGVVRIKLKDGAGTYSLKVGKVSKGESRFVVPENGDGTVFVLGSWAGKWAVADQKAFEDDGKPPAGPGGPGGPGGPPGGPPPGGDDEGPDEEP